MDKFAILKSIPSGSIFGQSAEVKERYWDILGTQPASVTDMLSSERTGAYVRGLAKTHNLPDTSVPIIAFAILEIGIGETPLSQLTETLTKHAAIAPQLAQKISQEIERELFAPIMLDLQTYVQQRRKALPPAVSPSLPRAQHTGGARNVLDLKNKPQAPLPPPIPRR